MYLDLVIFAVFILIYSSVAGAVERTWISGAIIFTAFGLLIGPVVLDLISFEVDREAIKTLAELTLALVLFTDAAGADLGVLKKFERLPVRLLLVGLPLTILLGFGVGVLLFQKLSLFEVALLATMLAPTDAALGKAVVTNEAVPNAVRQGLNVESGLNDGICVPILFLFLALAAGKVTEGGHWQLAIKLVAEEIGIGLAVGLLLTVLAVWLLKFAKRRQMLTETWKQVTVVALALACFAAAQFIGGSGFIAAFSGGLLFGGMAKQHREEFLIAAEGTGDTMSLITWVIFGAAVVSKAIGNFSWLVVLYSILSLTLIRMLPVFFSLTGLRANTESKLFVGWFGPRGLASVVFAVIVLNANLPNGGVLAMTVVCTVIFSIILHGISANPWVKGFGERSRDAEGATDR
ncbi:MAG: cation:proton antiporter [Deltaproteobacteria bacterium]|nr:cation:proton antiporter [Deltaproteobacteria bacterium]